MSRRSRIRFMNFISRVVNSKLTYIIAGAIAAAAVVVLVIFLFSAKSAVVERDTVSFSVDQTGIIVRNEKLYKAENYAKTEFIAEEGQVVAAGAEVANVYSWEYNDEVVDSLRLVREKILDYQVNNIYKDVISKDLDTVNDAIHQCTLRLQAVVLGDSDEDLQKLEREIDQLMEERSKLLKASVQADDTLTAFYAEEAALLANIDGWKITSYAENDGIVSFYFDGAETLLTPDNMYKLSVKDIEDVLNGKKYYAVAGENSARPLYRLVDRDDWYVVALSSREVPEFENDTAFQVRFTENDELKYVGKVEGRKEEDGKYKYYFHFNQSIDKLLLARTVDMTISADYVGLSVPEKAIKEKNGVTGVNYSNEGEKRQFAEVRVLIRYDGKALIEPVDIASTLETGSIVHF